VRLLVKFFSLFFTIYNSLWRWISGLFRCIIILRNTTYIVGLTVDSRLACFGFE
jgi:hypothetical protein